MLPSSGMRCTSTSACCSACHVRFCRLPALRACGRRDSDSPSPILLADEGVSRMQTSLRRRHRDRVVRRGIGMMIESDFYATEAGRQHFSDQLTSIRYW